MLQSLLKSIYCQTYYYNWHFLTILIFFLNTNYKHLYNFTSLPFDQSRGLLSFVERWEFFCQRLFKLKVRSTFSFVIYYCSVQCQHWYNLVNMQIAKTLFSYPILEFCMWFDNQEELMKESKVWNIKKNANKKKI